MNIKKLSALIILIALIISMGIAMESSTSEENKVLSSEIVLIPLDSRPCNTDYILYAGAAVNKNISFPKNSLDNYHKPSNSEDLYKFLNNSLYYSDTYIIYTNQILNGGLISSRNPQSYIDMESKLQDFTSFLETAKKQDKKIIVVSVLPRVIPSQFTDLWNFYDELINFSTGYGKYQVDLSIPTSSSPPKEILERYLSIYSGSDLIINTMKSNVENKLIDLLVIGQDDTFIESITNQQLNKYLKYNNEKIIVQPGADELTSLILAKLIRDESSESYLDLKLIYTDLENAKEVKAFESFSTETRSKQLLDFLSITLNEGSENLAIIHNKPGKADSAIRNINNNLNKNYLGLIDIAYVNRGDKELFNDLSFIKNLKGYSGWNTAGNSLGTEYSNLVIFDYLQKYLSSFSEEEQLKMIKNYHNLIYIHFADDFLYQALLRDQLNTFLLKNKDDFSFINNEYSAEDFLQNLFTEESDSLNKALSGAYNNFNTLYKIDQDTANILLPWKRTFEARIIPSLKIIK